MRHMAVSTGAIEATMFPVPSNTLETFLGNYIISANQPKVTKLFLKSANMIQLTKRAPIPS